MNATARLTAAPQPLLPALARFGIAVAVGAILAVSWIAAESQSHRAVGLSSAAMSPAMHVTLPRVEIVAAAAH